jgi:hypothetical protein
VTERSEDELWRSIVDNYGDRAELAEEEPPRPEPASVPLEAVVDDEEERFVPPPPPPLPRPDNKRLVAWAGVLGVPLLLLVLVLASVRPPTLVSYALVAWFVGGFTFLVLQMPRGPRDPEDDGARL